MLQIREDGSFAETNDLRIQEEAPDVKTVKRESPNPEIKKITEKFDHVFQGIGKIRDKKNDKDFYAKFSRKPEAVPVAQKPRPVAFYLQKPLKRWLEQCIEGEIFEEVPEGEPVTWCSPFCSSAKAQVLREGKRKHDKSQRGPQGTQTVHGETQDHSRNCGRRFYVQIP